MPSPLAQLTPSWVTSRCSLTAMRLASRRAQSPQAPNYRLNSFSGSIVPKEHPAEVGRPAGPVYCASLFITPSWCEVRKEVRKNEYQNATRKTRSVLALDPPNPGRGLNSKRTRDNV